MRRDNPVLAEFWRNNKLESLHRGAWVVVNSAGDVIESAGDPDQAIFPRSATKSLQALPLIETGAADAFGFDPQHIALALASHSGEPRHLAVAQDGLDKIELPAEALQCGPQRPFNSGLDATANRITNNCSGKHVGFLAVSQHLGEDPAHYLAPDGAVQTLVRAANAEMTDTEPSTLGGAVDGCSAPTFHLPLRSLATGLARVANPQGLAPERADACRRITAAATAHPDLVAGTHQRLCTDLMSVTGGRIFAKVGAEAVYTLGVVDADVGFAIKIDDGALRGFNALIISTLRRLELLIDDEVEKLETWASRTLHNWDGIPIGDIRLP